ncbi:MltA domain-containing protein [Caulobacter sp. 17J65-9]|uniref:MltA domain-containing protein n=1 Tax=Caulobacter sp. 17J65-9 TaxID=2709382 RepID=UPI0013CA6D34|nr:transglycosylase [Caulobacter sp. 17J65-9]
MSFAGRLGAFAGLSLLAACATAPTGGPVPNLPPAQATHPMGLAGWAQEDHLAALKAYQAGCGADRTEPGKRTCAAARAMRAADPQSARHFFETRFVASPVEGTGLLTAYFAPEYPAKAQADAEFSAPVRPRPADLVKGQAYAERSTIEASPPNGALAWMRPEDLFFLQIQGSGYLTFPDGRRQRAGYAADNGRQFVGVARVMVQRGLLAPNQTSGDAIRDWLAANRGPSAQGVMNANPRYVFFNLLPDDHGDPPGAAGVPLPAGRSIAVDPSKHSYGELFWIDADNPTLQGAARDYRRLVVALDTGGAIKGPARADLYMGRGAAAGAEAGRVKHPLRMWRLTPVG